MSAVENITNCVIQVLEIESKDSFAKKTCKIIQLNQRIMKECSTLVEIED